MKTIIIDTNFLLSPGRFKLDIFEEIARIMDDRYELAIMQGTKEELEKIAKTGKTIDKIAARIALQLIDTKALKTIPSSIEHVDDAIVQIADTDTIVATQDKELQKRLFKKEISVIIVEQKKKLAIRQR